MVKKRHAAAAPLRLLTEGELPLMQILWRHEGATASEVQEELAAQGKRAAYTTVSTLLRILEQKGAVTAGRNEAGRSHRYLPSFSKADYEARTVQHLVSTVFEGEAGPLVARLIEAKGLSESELGELRALLRKAGKG